MEKQPTEEELEAARERARTDAEARYAYEISGREPDEQPASNLFPTRPRTCRPSTRESMRRRSRNCADRPDD
jgi:hypothetical protein